MSDRAAGLEQVFPGDSATSRLMRAHDWSAHPLGDPLNWPLGLRVPLGMMLTSRFEMWLGWGPDLAFFYNDAYVPTLGDKHPHAIGRPMQEVWKEVYAAVEDRIVSVMRDGVATWDKALMLLLERSGYPEETFHTFSYSPLRGDTGAIEGLMCVVTEDTERVLAARRLEGLRALDASLIAQRSRTEVVVAASKALAASGRDFPFSVVRLFDGEPDGGDPLARVRWPMAAVEAGVATSVAFDLPGVLDDPPAGPWDRPPTRGLITPILKPGEDKPAGALIVGLNPYRAPDAAVEEYAALLAGQIAGALAGADARAAEEAETNRLRELFQQSPSFIAMLRGPDHRFELVNPGYQKLVAHRDVIGQTVAEALPEVVGQGFVALLDEVYASGKAYIGQSAPVMLQPGPGEPLETRVLDFIYQPIHDAQGAVTGVFVEGVDVTDAHDATLALKESEARFRTLAEAMPNQVWTADPDGMLNWFNSRAYDYGGAQPGSLDGAAWMRMVHPDDVDGSAAAWAAAVASGQTYETEMRVRRADGEYRWHVARAIPTRGADGTIIQWIGANTDIHDQKSAAENLEREVAERTGELMAAEEALRQAQKMEAVGQLTGGIAHDFNNLLAGIVGSLELLEKRVQQGRLEAVNRYLDAAHGAARRAASLTQRLLAFSRRQTLDPRPVNVNKLIAGMEDLIRRTTGPTVEIEVVGAAGLWATLVDQNQLENALLNLCINARDAMPAGGRITIETANKWLDDKAAKERELPPGQYISLCVTDTGTGMTPEVIERAFDPFFTTKPLGEGTGLGLSMIYGFVRQSHGQVRIYSEVGQGTTMCLYLPRYLGDEEEADQGQGIDAADHAGHGETVLVIDDEPTVRMLISDVLAEAGYNAVIVSDGAAGLKVLQSNQRVDLLITDVGLPGGINGRQVADAARVSRPDLKVLFITGYAENAVVGNGHLEPGMAILTKPFAIDALANRIRTMLDG